MHLPCIKHRLALPLFKKNNMLQVAVADPTLSNLQDLKFQTGLDISLLIVSVTELHQAINYILNIQLSMSQGEQKLLKDSDEDAPIVRFIDQVIFEAVSNGVSDIHFEPYENKFRIRFRQDGLLREMLSSPQEIINRAVTRLKVMGGLDISERRLPQDGRFHFKMLNRSMIDLRINTCPLAQGEKVVLRILDSAQSSFSVDVLGMEQDQKNYFLKSIQAAQGMVLVTGPTGCGKTMTLYAALNIINTEQRNILTIEDPIEIQLLGINQSMVNRKAGFTFAAALRAFLRQDPDAIMVGEIRDLETAEVAIRSAQTGHLVLSTLHTNSAAETIVRLVNMGIVGYNIAGSLRLIIAQRLVRKLCEFCKQIIVAPEKVLLEAGFTEQELFKLQVYGPGSCVNCHQGYKGRIGIFEVMPISNEISQLIMQHAHASVIAAQAKTEGMMSLRRAGLEKVKQGLTSVAEINRVIEV